MHGRRIRIDRRSIVTAAGGLALGMVATGALALADGFQRMPSVTIIGEDAAQFSLVHAGGAKVGVLCGPPTAKLLSAIPPLLGWTSAHLDVIAIAPDALTPETAGWLSTGTPVRTVLVLGSIAPAQVPAMQSGIQVRALAQPALIRLSSEIALDFLPSFTTEIEAGTLVTTGAMVAVGCGQQAIAIAGEPSTVLLQSMAGSSTMLVTPGGDLRPVVAAVRPRALAINGDERLEEQIVPKDLGLPEGPVALLRTYTSSPVVVELAPAGLRLPSRTHILASPAASRP